MSSPLLSLHMIVRDEEVMLPDCLASVAGLVDEMVIVDTGSRDATVAIAQRFGARVLHLPWQDDFAAARNFGLAAISSQWVLFMDADDRLEPADLSLVRPLAAARERDAYLFRTISYVGERAGGSSVSCSQIRLFRADAGFRYAGRIHERLVLPPHVQLGYQPVRVYHLGYLTPVVQSRDKVQRNVRILQAMLAAAPDDSFTRFNLGTEWVRLREWDQAITAFEHALAIVQQQAGWAPDLVRKLAVALTERQRYADAQRVLQQGLHDYPDYTDLQYLLASLHHRAGHHRLALVAYQRCLAMGEAPPAYTTDDGVGSHLAWLGAGLVHRDMGNQAQAVSSLMAALQARPDFSTPLPPLLGCLREGLGLRGTLAFLHERLELTPAIGRKLAGAALEQREYRVALALLRKFGRADSDAERLQRGHCYLGLGQWHRALAEWAAVAPETPAGADAQRHRELVRWLLDPLAPTVLPPAAGLAERLNLVSKLLECGQVQRVMEVLTPPDDVTTDERFEVADTLARGGAVALAGQWVAAIAPGDLSVAQRCQQQELLADAALVAGQLQVAAALYRQMLAGDPQSLAAFAGWARTLIAQALALRPAWTPEWRRRLRRVCLWKGRKAYVGPHRPVRHRPQ